MAETTEQTTDNTATATETTEQKGAKRTDVDADVNSFFGGTEITREKADELANQEHPEEAETATETETATEEPEAPETPAETPTEEPGTTENPSEEGGETATGEGAEAPTEPETATATTDEPIEFMTEEPTATTDEPTVNQFEQIAKNLNIEDATQAGVEKYIEELKTQVTPSDSKLDDNHPLAEAIKLAEKGGDWQGLLQISVVDLDGFTEQALLENDLRQKKWNTDQITAYIENKSEVDIKREGETIRETLKSEQLTQRNNIQDKAQQAIDLRNQSTLLFNREVETFLKSTDNIAGYKVTDGMSKSLSSDLTGSVEINGQPVSKMMAEMFFKDNKWNAEKVATAYFFHKYREPLKNFHTGLASNEAKRDVKRKLSDTEITGKPVSTSETPTTKSPMKMAIEKMQGGDMSMGEADK